MKQARLWTYFAELFCVGVICVVLTVLAGGKGEGINFFAGVMFAQLANVVAAWWAKSRLPTPALCAVCGGKAGGTEKVQPDCRTSHLWRVEFCPGCAHIMSATPMIDVTIPAEGPVDGKALAKEIIKQKDAQPRWEGM